MYQNILPCENDCILFIGYAGEDTLAWKVKHDKDNKTININGKPIKNEIKTYVDKLPKMDDVEKMLIDIGCPTKFSQIGVDEELLKRTLLNAYTVRTRFTLLTYFHDKNLWNDKLINYIIDRHL